MRFPSVIPVLLAATTAYAAESLPPDHAALMTRGLDLFQKDVRKLLVDNCLKCHGGEKTKSDFDLATREDLLKGGEDGVAVVPFKSAESRILKLLQHEEEPYMPEKKPKLALEAVRKIAEWIDLGAPYDAPLVAGKKPARDKSVVTDDDRAWWAFQPLAKVQPPAGAANPIDAFIVAKAGRALVPQAPSRVLARRLYLDLTGLPPTPAQVAAFEKAGIESAAEQLLDSPAYAERWARHWLDVARFAESSGFEHDYDRPGAFHYRDFVIKALQADMPYDQFVRWQIAGDEVAPDDSLALSATGFLGAGVFPTQITANEVERTRYDAMDDMLSTTGLAFLGLTVGCARCHDHKYDPIPTRDYYRMLSTFTTTVRSVVNLDMEPEKTRAELAKWKAERDRLKADLDGYGVSLQPAFEQWLASGAPHEETAEWTILEPDSLKSKGGATFRSLGDGSYLAEGTNALSDAYTFTVNTSLDGVRAIKVEALAHSSMTNGGPGRAANGNFGLSRIRVYATPVGEKEREIAIAKAEADFEQNHTNLSAAASLDEIYLTGWAVDPQFGKDHAAVFTFAEPIAAPRGTSLRVVLEFSVNANHSIGRPRISITNDISPTLKGGALLAKVSSAFQMLKQSGATALEKPQRDALFDWWKDRDAGWREREARIAAHTKSEPGGKVPVLICAEGYPPHRMHTQGADFFPETYYLKRGNADLKDGVAPAGFLQVLSRAEDTAWQHPPPAGAKFSGRRTALAAWLTDVDRGAGALLARVIVNRLWQHHFGTGLVATPNDFGHTGTAPTHPELLDWLAGELIRNGWHLKPIHQLIVTSATWQQGIEHDASGEGLFIGRRPTRLEGEAIRDSILAVSGALDAKLYGPGTKDERSRRRSIYFTMKRSQLIGSMVAFDQPEPLVSQGHRPITTVAPQALLLMNGPQIREWAGLFARRVARESANVSERIGRAYTLALARDVRPDELQRATAFIEGQEKSYEAENRPNAAMLALTDFCQVLFGLNEFAYLR